MPTFVSIGITGNRDQALLKVRNRLDQHFGARNVAMEHVRDDAGALVELRPIFSDDTPASQIAAFLESLRTLNGRQGEPLVVPLGSGGIVGEELTTDFEAGIGNRFSAEGAITALGQSLSGPTVLTTILTPVPHDLSLTPLATGAGGIEPGSVSIAVTVGGSPETITDDGAGGLSGTGGSLPGGGTVTYGSGAMTGVTAALDALTSVTETHADIVGPTTIHTDGGGGLAHDLSTTPITTGAGGIFPGSVSITVTIGAVVETITDDGAGGLSGTGGSLPGGGTITYATGAMTGTTAALDASSTVDETHADITAPVGLFTNPGDGPLDLATTPIPTGASAIVPGSLSIAVTIGASGETITDDGVGGLSGTGGSLGAGTVDYDTGAMTGITSTLDGASTATASFTLESGLSGVSSVEISSSGTGGRVSFASRPTGSGAPPAVMEWSFAVRFPADFGLNNNSVTGAQSLLLEARLADALTLGGNIVLAWAALSDDAVAPTAWDTPTFTQGSPTTAPTAALALPMDGTWARVTIALVNATTLSVDVDGTTETFTFPRALLVPTEAALRHTWGDALDRAFTVDDWSFSFELPRP